MPDYKFKAPALKNGEMIELEFSDTKVLIVKTQQGFFALGCLCSHYKAELIDGVLCDNSLMCPWHHAVFDVKSGELLQPPALDGIPSYPIKADKDELIINIPEKKQKVEENLEITQNPHFIILGGGASGLVAAQELRKLNFKGRITIISQSSLSPIDRPNISKEYLEGISDPSWMPLRSTKWFERKKIELKLNSEVIGIDPKNKTVSTQKGDLYKFDKLFISTGSSPQGLNPPMNHDFRNVFTLRSQEDADKIIPVADKSGEIVVIGASFIGMEVAASLVKRKLKVTVIAIETIPFERILGKEVGQVFQSVHESFGINFRLGQGIRDIHGTEGLANEVELFDGSRIKTDLIVLGTGVKPTTEFLNDSTLSMNSKDNSLIVSMDLKTNHPDIYAGGDIAEVNGLRIEHWRVAQQHGIMAARSMMEIPPEFNGNYVPFFWTRQLEFSLRYVGHSTHWDNVIIKGDLGLKSFIAYYLEDGIVKAAAGSGHDKDICAIEFILSKGIPLTLEKIKSDEFDPKLLI